MGETVEQSGAAFYGEGWEKWVFSKTPSRSRRGGKESPQRALNQRFSMCGKKISHEKGSKRRPARNARRAGGEGGGTSTHETDVIKGGDAEMNDHRWFFLKASGKPPSQWRSLDLRWLCRRSLGRPPFWWLTLSFHRRPVLPRRSSRRFFGMGGGRSPSERGGLASPLGGEQGMKIEVDAISFGDAPRPSRIGSGEKSTRRSFKGSQGSRVYKIKCEKGREGVVN